MFLCRKQLKKWWMLLFVSLLAGSAVAGEDSRLQWGTERLREALADVGASGVRIQVAVASRSLQLPETARKPEGFFWKATGNTIRVTGYDAAGTLYGCLRAASEIRSTGGIPAGAAGAEAPVMGLRGVCILLMKLGSYNYPIVPEEFPFFYNRKLWLGFLDFLAENRFNYVALWNAHPFAYFVRLPKYPEANAGMPPGQLQRNHDLLKWLIAEGAKRNIRFFFEFYNIHTSVYFQRAHGLKDEYARPTPLLRDYTSYVLERFVREFPEVGLYMTAGEALSKDAAVPWLRQVIFPAIRRSGHRIPVFLRAWYLDFQAARQIARDYPDLYFEHKYNVEMIADTLPDPAIRIWTALTGKLVLNVHMAANLEPFRWNPPAYIQRCMRNALAEGATDLHLYPRKPWRWPYGCDRGLKELQWQRDRFWFEMWGRYAWNPFRSSAAEQAFWQRRLDRFTGNAWAGNALLESFETGADVLPALQRLFWLGDDNHTVVAAGAKVVQVQQAEGIPFLKLSGVVPIPEYVRSVEHGAQLEEKSPIKFLRQKLAAARQATKLAEKALMSATRNRKTLARYLSDARAVELVAQFYLDKCQAAVAKSLMEAGVQAEQNRRKFLAELSRSLSDFRQLTALTDSTYTSISDVPARQPVRLNVCPYHWRDVLPYYDREFRFYRQALSQPLDSLFTEPSLPGLAGIFYGDPRFHYPDRPYSVHSLRFQWNAGDERIGHHWSARWFGFISPPVSGWVTFVVRTDHPVTLRVAGKTLMEISSACGGKRASIYLEKGRWYSFEIAYDHPGGDTGQLTVTWLLPGRPESPIPPERLRHSRLQEYRMQEISAMMTGR